MFRVNFVESLRNEKEDANINNIRRALSSIIEKYGCVFLKEKTNVGEVYLHRGAIYPELITIDQLIPVLAVGGYTLKVVDFDKKEYYSPTQIQNFLFRAQKQYVRLFDLKEYRLALKKKGLKVEQTRSQLYGACRIKIETLIALADIFVYDVILIKNGQGLPADGTVYDRDNIIDRAKMCIENLDDLSENTLRKELMYFCNFILSDRS